MQGRGDEQGLPRVPCQCHGRNRTLRRAASERASAESPVAWQINDSLTSAAESLSLPGEGLRLKVFLMRRMESKERDGMKLSFEGHRLL